MKRYESDRLIGLCVTLNCTSILFINVHFPVVSDAKCQEYIMCFCILRSILESHDEDNACILGDLKFLMQHQIHRDLIKLIAINTGKQ